MEVNSSSAISVIPWRNEDSLEGYTVYKISDKAQPIHSHSFILALFSS